MAAEIATTVVFALDLDGDLRSGGLGPVAFVLFARLGMMKKLMHGD
jgi:hypothetical protein